MKFNQLAQTLAAGAAATLVAACGGGGGGGASPTSGADTLEITGTAATGKAASNATVAAKCAVGSGTTSTSASGAYILKIEGAALPCIVQVTLEGGGNGPLALHSLVETASTGGSSAASTAIANVTPVTEMIVARVIARLPREGFDNFDPSLVTKAGTTTATTEIVGALKTAGVDLGGIDPLKAPLVAASGSTPGNSYDQVLDALGARITPDALPLVVNQIAAAAVTNSGSGLAEAMTALSGGALTGCPTALSGKYRTMDLFGRTVVRELNFLAGKFAGEEGVGTLDITADPTKPCTFVATGTVNGATAQLEVAMGPAGVGTYRARYLTPVASAGTNGYIFPVQAQSSSALQGTWDSLESGYQPADGIGHWAGKMTFSTDDKLTMCTYDTTFTCVPDGPASVNSRSDGGFDLVGKNDAGATAVLASLYAYRAPNGSLTLFASTNPGGVNDTSLSQSIVVGTKLKTLEVPAVGTVNKYNETNFMISNGTRSTIPPTADSSTIVAADTASSTATRERGSDGRQDQILFNKPVTGLRLRPAGTWNGQAYGAVYQMPVPGAGFTISYNASPTGFYLHSIAMARP